METYALDIGDSVFLAHSLLHLFVGYYFWSIIFGLLFLQFSSFIVF